MTTETAGTPETIVPSSDKEIAKHLAVAVGDAFTLFTTERQAERDDVLALTMSGLGGCTRQGAYRLAGTKPSEPIRYREMREANIGTMIHAGLLPHLATLLGGSDEIDVTLTAGGLTIAGRADLYSPEWKLVADLKTVGPHKMALIGDVAVPAHRVQVAGYATAARASGKQVHWIAWVYLDRATGAEHVVVEEFTDELVDMVEQRCTDLATYAADPDTAPRDQRGPGLSIICDQCPWLRQCWGADAAPGEVGAQRILAHDDAGVADAIRLYDEARARAKQAKDDQEFARAMFSGYEPGAYGEWEFYWSSGGETNDKDAAIALLDQAGIPIPRKATPQRLVVKRSRHTTPRVKPEETD